MYIVELTALAESCSLACNSQHMLVSNRDNCADPLNQSCLHLTQSVAMHGIRMQNINSLRCLDEIAVGTYPCARLYCDAP
jgi:hypothetical protein